MLTSSLLPDLAGDLRHAARQLRHNPGFALVATAILALGIGANTAIFTLVNAMYLRSAPYPEPERLVEITKARAGQTGWPVFDSRQYLEFAAHATTLESVAASRDRGSIHLIRNGEARETAVIKVTASYFRTLGAEPALGRSFTKEEDSPGGPPVVVLSHRAWRSLFDSDRQIVGREVNLGGAAHTVVGVLGERFPNQNIDFWIPQRARPIGDGDNIYVFARLKPGVTAAAASAELTSIFRDVIARHYPRYPRDLIVTLQPHGSSEGRGIRQPMTLVSAAAALILLIACANLASLLLARSTTRAREIAVRSSLGAGRGRIVRQLLAESLLIGLLGAAAGLALAYALVPAILELSPVPLGKIWQVRIDPMVLAFSTAAGVLTSLLFGIAPAVEAARLDLNGAMKDGGARGSSSRAGGRLRTALVAAEVALSIVLLISSGLLLRTFANLMNERSGADESNVLSGQMSLQGARYDSAAEVLPLFRRGLERLRNQPEIESAAVTLGIPMMRSLNTAVRIPSSQAPEEQRYTEWRYVTPHYFSLLRIPLLAGRPLTDADTSGAALVAVVNQSFAKRYFAGKNPLGELIQDGPQTRTIVGIVGDVKTQNLRQPSAPTMYVPVEQAPDEYLAMAHTWFPVHWVVRTRAGAGQVSAMMTRELKAVDPLAPFSRFQTLSEVRGKALAFDRFLLGLLWAFAALALVLAAAGIYGLTSYAVAQQRRDFGIRLVLGATPAAIMTGVLGRGLGVALAGVAVGAAAAVAVTRLLESFLFGVKPLDAFTYVAAAALLVAIAAAACLVPARRAAMLDPAQSLRAD